MSEHAPSVSIGILGWIRTFLRRPSLRVDRRMMPLVTLVVASYLTFFAHVVDELATVWYVLEESDGGAGSLSAVSLATVVPMILGSTVSGVLVDRYGARLILLISRTGVMLTIAAKCLLLSAGFLNLELVILLAIAISSFVGMSFGAESSRTPLLARYGGVSLARYNAVKVSAVYLAILGGFALGGPLVEVSGVLLALAVAAAVAALGAAVIAVGFPAGGYRNERDLRPIGILRAYGETLRFAINHRLVRVMVVVGSSILGVGQSARDVALPILVYELGREAGDLSMLIVASLIGALLGLAAYAFWVSRRPPFEALMLGLGIFLGSILLLLVTLNWGVVIGVVAGVGLALGILEPLGTTVVQKATPRALLARTVALMGGAMMVPSLIIVPLTGAVDSAFGTEGTVVFFAVILAGLMALGWQLRPRS